MRAGNPISGIYSVVRAAGSLGKWADPANNYGLFWYCGDVYVWGSSVSPDSEASKAE